MTTREEELGALQAKIGELNDAIAQWEANLAATPCSPENATAREMMEKMLAELRRMDKNLKKIMCGGNEAEGGKSYGNH